MDALDAPSEIMQPYVISSLYCGGGSVILVYLWQPTLTYRHRAIGTSWYALIKHLFDVKS